MLNLIFAAFFSMSAYVAIAAIATSVKRHGHAMLNLQRELRDEMRCEPEVRSYIATITTVEVRRTARIYRPDFTGQRARRLRAAA